MSGSTSPSASAPLTSDATLTMRSLGRSTRILVAAPGLAARCGDDVAVLANLPTLATTDQMGPETWIFTGPDGVAREVRHDPRLACVDFQAVRDASIAGLGIALLPDHTCYAALAAGQLVQVFPQWRRPDGIVHLVFTTRRGLPPVVRCFIDHLAAAFRHDAWLRVPGTRQPEVRSKLCFRSEMPRPASHLSPR